MGLFSQEWADIQNQHLQALGAKTTGQRWISAIIKNIWDTTWDAWNYRNQKLKYTYGPTKMEILNNINAKIT